MRHRAILQRIWILGLVVLAAIGIPYAQEESKPGAGERKPTRTATGPRVWMTPSTSVLNVGERLTLSVDIDGLSDVGHVPFQVTFDPAVLQFDSGDEGGYLASDGKQTAFFAAPTSSGDTVVVGLSRLGRVKGVGGAGRLCDLHFVAIGSGPANLAFVKAKVRNSSNQIVDAEFRPASVDVR